MALPSTRQDSKVNPDDGIYVEMEGIMEVRYSSEDVDFYRAPEDMFEFQKYTRYIPDDFCHKNKVTTEQAFFFCLVCDCDLKNLRPLKDHVKGQKHIRKATEKKRQILGLEKEPQNAPRKKEQKKERPRVDIGKTLESLLRECGEPAIGLEFITEFTNPRNPRDHPMYTCKLEGCKSAWGTSDDIFNHVKNAKHQRNFFKKLYPDDGRILGMPKDQLLIKSAEYEEEEGGSEERDYSLINKVEDHDQYQELRDRPDDWSEKKAQLGLVGVRCNSNMEPLGARKRKHSDTVSHHVSQFDEESWSDWQPPTLNQALNELETDFVNSIKDLNEMVEDFKGKKDDEEYQDIVSYQETCLNLLSLFVNDEAVHQERPGFRGQIQSWQEEYDIINNNLMEKVEAEDRDIKEVSKLMSELEEEILQFYSQKTTRKYKNVRERITELTAKVGRLQPTSESNKALKDQHKERLANLWQEFEDRAEPVLDVIQRHVAPGVRNNLPDEMTKSERHLAQRKAATDNYTRSLTIFVLDFLRSSGYRPKFSSEEELQTFAETTVTTKLLQPEIKSFMKKMEKRAVASWKEFVLTDATKENVKKYLVKKMERY